jgi:hypothetical protein
MRFARWVFLVAAIYGFLTITPLYFAESQIGLSDPPAIAHTEYFYGFIGVTLAWQVAFLMIARDPVRYRPIMLAAVLEKAAYGVGTLVLVSLARVNSVLAVFAVIDLALCSLFLRSFQVTGRAQ